MTIEQVRQAYSARPFRPFALHMADGRHFTVTHPESVAFSPTGVTISVYSSDGVSHIIDLLLVAELEVKPMAQGPSKRSRR